MKPTPKRKPAPLDVRTLKWCERMLRAEAKKDEERRADRGAADGFGTANSERWWAGSANGERWCADIVKHKIRAIERAGRE